MATVAVTPAPAPAAGRRPAADLRSWLAAVEELGELQVVTGATAEEDIGMATELAGRVPGTKALLFDEIPGYRKGFRVLSNSLNSFKRIALTLGLPLDLSPQELVVAWQQRVKRIQPIEPVEVKDGPIFENVLRGEDVDCTIFPAPKWHEHDGGRYLGTGSFDITRDPDTGWVNLGTYRVMVHDKTRLGFYISPGKHGRIHRDKWFARGEKMPVAFVAGSDPLLFLAACTEIQFGLTEYAWAGGVRGEPYRIIKGPVTGLPLPADAEIVIEGFADPHEREIEGPFGEWTGYYASMERPEPVLRVEAIYHRNDPIILGSPPNVPPDEQAFYRAFMRSALLRGELEAAGIPDIAGVWCHAVGGSRLFNVIAIKQRYAGHARQAGHLAASCHAGGYLGRYVVVVDDDIDPMDLEQVIWAMCTRSDPVESIDFIQRAWSGPLDPRIPKSRKGFFSSRAIIDATKPFEWKDEFPKEQLPSPETRRKAMERWGWLLSGAAPKR
ncbi:MAG TPA: UbiD family decarboxylase [Thermodesulfobacteriota bacterium]|nr:UbiD family decarboxylase [Thermodesulfobacteriota bacterium]